MGVLSSIGLDVVVAVVTAIWFIVVGARKIGYRPPSGRRVVPVSTAAIVIKRVRGVLEFLGGLAVLGLATLSILVANVPPIGMPIGIGLSCLALWTAVESWVPPLRPVRIIFAILGFVLAVFFTGFRG